MTRSDQPARQPLLWAALVFSVGLWVGVRAWRPPTWWIAATLAFVIAGLWFLRRRPWMAKGLSLGAWFLVGALMVQVRRPEASDPRMAALSDGHEVTITAHVVREGYERAAGARSLRRTIDIETETIESGRESYAIRAGVRLTIYEHVEPTENMESRAPSPGMNSLEATSGTGGAPVAPLTYGTRLRVRAKLHPPRNYRNPAHSITKAICGIAELRGWGRRARSTSLHSLASKAMVPSAGARAFMPASSGKFMSCGLRSKRRSWTPWSWAKTHSSKAALAQNSSAPAPTTSWWSRA